MLRKELQTSHLSRHLCLTQNIQKQTFYDINVFKNSGAKITSNHNISEHLLISLTKLKGQMLAFVEKLASPLLS